MEEVLAKFKKGNRNYLIIKALIDAGGETVGCRDLIAVSVLNPLKRVLLNNPGIYAKEKKMLAYNIKIIRKRIDGFSILWDKKAQGYRLIGL